MSLDDYACWSEDEEEGDGADTTAFSCVDAAEWYAENHLEYVDYAAQLSTTGVRIHVRRLGSNDVVCVRVLVSLEPYFRGKRE